MAPYEALYGRRCRSSIGWFDTSEVRLHGTDLLQDSLDRVRLNQDRCDKFGRKGKLIPRYIHRFEILFVVGEVAYKLALPLDLAAIHPVFHVSMFQKHISDPSYVIRWDSIQLDDQLTFVEEPVLILASDIVLFISLLVEGEACRKGKEKLVGLCCDAFFVVLYFVYSPTVWNIVVQTQVLVAAVELVRASYYSETGSFLDLPNCNFQGSIARCLMTNSQVPVFKTNLKYVRKLSSKRNRQPSKVYQSPFASVFDSGSKDKEVIQSHKKLKYSFEGHNINGPYAKDLFSKFSVWMSAGLYNPHATKKGKDEYYTAKYADLKSSLDFVVAHLVKKSWFYYMAQPSNCWNDEHIDVVFYYLRKKAKQDTTSEYRYTIVNCVFMNYIHDTYTHYHRSHFEIDLSSHDENVHSMKVASVERSICEIMQGLCISAVIVLKERCIRVYDLRKGHRGHADEINELAEMLSTYLTISDFFEKKDCTDLSLLDAYKEKTDQHAFDVHIVDGIVQQSSGTLNCGLFVAAFAEYLSDCYQIPSSEFDSKKHHTRYAYLLWDYGVNNTCTGYVSDNQDPPRPKQTFIRSEDTEMIDVEL
ncbi:hypothetical protein FXO37_31559 [Capsicum annuum]|nr:hypothetical protein FXO37_31559 [Capsicum annuum]